MESLRWSRALGALGCACLLLQPPTVVLAGGPVVSPGQPNSVLVIEDVALGDQQSFEGVVVDENGQPRVATEVVVTQLGREVARTTTDELGGFSFRGLRSGLHLAKAGQGAGLYRIWATGTAPPNARSKATLVDSVTVRGQRPFKQLLASRAVIFTAIMGAAVFIPIAVHDARNDKDSGS